MNWGEFKRQVESHSVDSETKIRLIDMDEKTNKIFVMVDQIDNTMAILRGDGPEHS